MPTLSIGEPCGDYHDYDVFLEDDDTVGEFVCLGRGITREVALRQAKEEHERIGHLLDAMLREHLGIVA